jgi:hypothetical protein
MSAAAKVVRQAKAKCAVVECEKDSWRKGFCAGHYPQVGGRVKFPFMAPLNTGRCAYHHSVEFAGRSAMSMRRAFVLLLVALVVLPAIGGLV